MNNSRDAATPQDQGRANAAQVNSVTPAEDMRTVLINNVSWGAILAGVATALVAQLIMNMIGIGVGAATLDPMNGDNPSPQTFSLVGALWWALSGIVAAFLGGYAASRLSGRPKATTGGWHGLTAWAASTLVIFFLIGSMVSGLIGGSLNALGGTVAGMGGSAASKVADSNDPFGSIEQTIRNATDTDPASAADAAVAAMKGLVSDNPANAAEARVGAAQVLARAQGISTEEAQAQVVAYEEKYRVAADQAKRRAAEAADAATKATSRGALLASIALLLGAVAAWFGGTAGAVNPTVKGRFFPRRLSPTLS